jgi:dTDP-4-dehydrorhamnose 3,5-epimerase
LIFTETTLKGAFVIDIEKRSDDRGFFARSFCQNEFTENGLNPSVAQCNISYNNLAGTLRGMHYQLPPSAEAKLVRCTAGELYDVIVDLRVDSPTFKKWFGVELTARNHRMLYVPEGFAHGYQTLVDDTEAAYQVSEFYQPTKERGIRWDDPAVGIEWLPVAKRIISPRDLSLPLLADAELPIVSP